MKTIKIMMTVLMVLLGTGASGSALAYHHHGHVRFGVFIGPGWYYPGPYYYPPYYYPPVVAVPSSPPVYVEQGSGYAAPERSDAYWYYCADSRTYYPYVNECPGGWQRVLPQPPSAP